VGLEPVEDYHGETAAVLTQHETPDEDTTLRWAVITEVLSQKMIRLLALTYFFLKPTRYANFAWGPLYLSQTLKTDILESGLLSAMFELAGPVSVFLGGFISDKYYGSRRMPISTICLVALAALLFAFPFLPETRLSLGLGFFFVGFFLYAPDSLLSGAAAVDFGTKDGASTAAGVINGCGSIGQILGLALPGFIVAIWGWDAVFWSMGCSILLAAILIAPQWNTLPNTTQAE
jgi:OPA family sugar phosphate sensor protein UhpC-like MFS transporter